MKSIQFVLTSVLLFCLAGCSTHEPRPAGMPVLVPCDIVVTQEGVPLVGAFVSLVPTDGGKDWNCVGMTDTSGVAPIKASAQYSGVPKGKYKVVIQKNETEKSKIAPISEDATDAARTKYENAIANENLATYSVVEQTFCSPETTPLTLDVTGKTRQVFDVGKAIKKIL